MDTQKYEYDVNEIIPKLWLGNFKASCNKQFLKKYNITNILTIMDNFHCQYNNVTHLTVPLKDINACSQNMIPIFDTCTTFINNCLVNNQSILVHCKKGHHRSAAIVVAYLIKYKHWDYVKAIKYINSLRPYALRRNTCMIQKLFEYYLHINGTHCDYKCIPS